MEIFIEQIVTGLSIGSILLIITGPADHLRLNGRDQHGPWRIRMLGAYGAWALKTFLGITCSRQSSSLPVLQSSEPS
jgi:hypothetical protein